MPVETGVLKERRTPSPYHIADAGKMVPFHHVEEATLSEIAANLLKHSEKDEFGNLILKFEDHRIKMAFDESSNPLLCYNDIEKACGVQRRQKAGTQWKNYFVHLHYGSSNPQSMARFVKLNVVVRILAGKRKSNLAATRLLRFLTGTIGLKVPADCWPRSDFPVRSKVEFRMIPGHDTMCVGSDGSVWSSKTKRWKQLKQFVNKNGYFVVGFKTDVQEIEGFRFHEVMLVHRLVLLAFHGLPGEDHIACHGNGVKLDNRPENLRWDTAKANSADTIRHQEEAEDVYVQSTKVTAEVVRKIRDLHSKNVSYRAIGKTLGISHSIVRAVALGITWKHIA